MKTRSALLVVFMIAVPAAAMFSHRIPPEVRRSLREQVGRLTAAVSAAEPVAAGGAGTPGSPVAARGPGAAVAGATPVAEPPSTPRDVGGPTTVVAAAPQSAPRGGADEIAHELARLGAIGFECRPVAGGGGEHVATCSVPLDGSGQLLRVFHGTGIDAREATAALLDDVTAWRGRTGLPRAATALGERPMRF